MTYIVLNDEQAQVVARALEPIEVRDPKGKVLAHIKPEQTAADIAEAKRRLAANYPRSTSQQVFARLQALEEERQRNGMDKVKMRQMLDRLRAEDQK